MTEQDSKNLFTVSDYIEKCWGLKDEDLAYLKHRIFNPVIAPEYRNLKFDENFRAILDIDIKKTPEFFAQNDKGWSYFTSLFRNATYEMGITYMDYLNNKKIIQKNEVKIKKILENYYKEDFNNFLNDVNPRIHSVENSYTPDDINKYIIKAFELIGIHKPKQNGMKLVISFNYADWLLCSTGETWSSCLDIERGAYWKGIASIFGDDNRALLYIASEGKKKSWDNVKVDSFIARAWVFLNEKNQKIISKFYPTEPIGTDVIRAVTNDSSFVNYTAVGSTRSKGKYELVPIRFKKDGIYATPYNDIVRINAETFFKSKKLVYEIGVKGGAQYFNCNIFSDSVSSKTRHHSDLKSFYKNKKTLNSEYRATTCDVCHGIHNIIDLQEFGICTNCITEDYGKCTHCGTYHLKKDLTKKVKGLDVCDICYVDTYDCDICGEREFYDNHNSIIISGIEYHYCLKCKETKIVYCDTCKTAMIKGINDYHRDGKFYCESCVKNEEQLSKYKVCKECRALLTEEEATTDFFENYYCDLCLQKERDKKQYFFDFI